MLGIGALLALMAGSAIAGGIKYTNYPLHKHGKQSLRFDSDDVKKMIRAGKMVARYV